MINFFLKNRILTNLLTVLVISVGLTQYVNVRREAFPEVKFDWVSITTIYPGGSPEEVEDLITHNIEDQLRGVDGIDRVQSFSMEGRSLIVVRMEEDLSEQEKTRLIYDIQQSVNRRDPLPEEAEEPIIEELSWDYPFITLSVAGGREEARDIYAEELADMIEDIPGISRVDQQGDRKREIWIEADRRKLDAARLTLSEVASAVRGANLDASAGTIEQGVNELLVRVMGAKETADEIADIILRGNDQRNFLRVRDVATVTERFADIRQKTTAESRPSINLQIRKVKSGDTIKLADEIYKIRDKLLKQAEEKGLNLVISDDQSFFIRRRLRVMTNNLYQGGFLILLALFIFLDWRLALVAALGVPISLFSVFAFAVPFGFTINLMTALAFIIVLGMLDDDSVVVAENIYRHMEMGKPRLQAALDGAREVVKPVLAAVAVSCCGFLPFAMVSGIMGKILVMIPLVVIIAFLASVLESFFILPAHVVEMAGFGKPIEQDSGGRWFKAVQAGYRKTMWWVLTHRAKFFGIVAAFVVFTIALGFLRLKFVFMPEGIVEQFFINLEMPKGSSLNETERVFKRIEEEVLKLPKEEFDTETGMIGFKWDEDSISYGTQFAQARVFLTPAEKRERTVKQIVEELRRKIGTPPEAFKIIYEELRAGPPVGKAVDVRVRGRDARVIGALVDRAKEQLAKLPGVADIRDSREGGKDELRIYLKPREAGFADLNAAGVAQNILYAVDGGEPSKIRRANEEVKIKVRLQENQRTKPEELLNLDVLNAKGHPVRLGKVAYAQQRPGVATIEHFNFRRAIQITASVDDQVVTSKQANNAIIQWFKTIKEEFPGIELIYGGEAEETEKSMKSLGWAFLLALALDYIILAAIFSSYIQPFIIILLTVPIGLMGVIYALFLHGQPASFMALLGVVSMTGVVINNAIVLVNFINSKRDEGVPIKEAVVEAGAVRLRPIFASSITTLLGLFPTAYGFGGYEPFVAPMALSLAWGLTFAMPMTIFLIPTAYVLLEDFKNTCGSFIARCRSSK